MICHVVLFKFHDGVGWDDPRFLEADRDVRVLPQSIPEILEWKCGRNVTNREIAYDYAVIGNFKDKSAVETYLYHPVHMRGVDQWRQFSTWVVTDFEL
ncbi:Dabb family protein [Streptomyces sp. NPDC059957]|uniref:Dabb family protein n=1 Tax=Streptomyces sp. NPDC059957 TaxID=3347016 RepID=UPI00364898A3